MPIDSQQVVGHQRQHHVELEIARLAGDGDRRIVADDLGGHHRSRLGNHRIDLARHDRGTGLQSRQLDLAQASKRTGVHPAQVVGDLHQAHGQRLQLTGQFHRGVLRRHAFEVVLGRFETHAGELREFACHRRTELRISIDAGADGRAAQRQSAHALQAVLDALDRRADLRGPAGELLPERHRHRIHQVRASGLRRHCEVRGARRSMLRLRCLSAGSSCSAGGRARH